MSQSWCGSCQKKINERKLSEQLKCVWCGNKASKNILPELCDKCFKKGCEAF